MSFGQLGSFFLFFWPCVVFIGGAAGSKNSTPVDGYKVNGYASWPFVLLFIIFLVAVVFAAMFSGLTIGLFGMDLITLDIVSSAGKQPDSTYAKRILPIRRYGHQLLVTLLIGNMLTMVVISQMVAAMVKSTDFVNFIVATFIIFVFAEIIPMGVCNKGPYALWVGAKSAPIVFVALFILYPIAKPLGLFLDCIVRHDAGLFYDRNELKKLFSIHCEKYAHKSGLGYEEMRMITGVFEMRDTKVRSIYKPLTEVLMLASNLPITYDLMEELWVCGKSRLPVYTADHDFFITGVLCVKDLINISLEQMKTGLTVGDVVNQHARGTVVVPEMMPLYDLLKVFQSGVSQLCLVERNGSDENVCFFVSLAGTQSAVATAAKKKTVTSAHATTMSNLRHGFATLGFAPEGNIGSKIVGIVTLEDVIENIIKNDIYDEYDRGQERSGRFYAMGHGEKGRYILQSDNESDWSERNLPGVDESYGHVCWAVPHANFFSYRVKDHVGGSDAMTEEQVLALSSFLVNSCVVFAAWSIGRMKCFIEQIGDCVVRLSEDEPDGPVLYRSGEWSDACTIILSGGVRIVFSDGGFSTEKRSFFIFGERALLDAEGFVPEYTATVARTSRYLRITARDLLEETQRTRRQGMTTVAEEEFYVP